MTTLHVGAKHAAAAHCRAVRLRMRAWCPQQFQAHASPVCYVLASGQQALPATAKVGWC